MDVLTRLLESLRTAQTFFDSVSNVEGSISGKSFKNTGNRNSMKGTTINTRKGTSRKRSAQVLSNCTKKSTAEAFIQLEEKKELSQRSTETTQLNVFCYSKPLNTPL